MENILSIEKKIKDKKELTFIEADEYGKHNYNGASKIDNLPPESCSNYVFILLLGRYLSDLSFSSKNYLIQNLSANIEKVEEFSKNYKPQRPYDEAAHLNWEQALIEKGLYNYVDAQTIQIEKSVLEKYAEEWDKIISVTNHTEKHLQRISKRARDGRTVIKNLFRDGKISADKKKHQLNLNLWKTKWVYIEASKIAERIKAASEFPYKLTLKGKKIFYTFDSMVHIVNRHFGHQLSNTSLINKSTHTVIIDPQNMHLQLERIFIEFEKCDLLTQEYLVPNNPLNFEYLSKKYQLYFREFDGLFQVDSLYPLEDESELQKLENYNLVKLSEEIALYVRK